MENLLTPAQIQAILQFLARGQINGAEAMVFVDCVTTLQRMLEHFEPKSEA